MNPINEIFYIYTPLTDCNVKAMNLMNKISNNTVDIILAIPTNVMT